MRLRAIVLSGLAIFVLCTAFCDKAFGESAGETFLNVAEELRKQALPEQALEALEKVITTLKDEIQKNESTPEVLARAYYLKANILNDLGRPDNLIQQALRQAKETAPGYAPDKKYISHPKIAGLLRKLSTPSPAPTPTNVAAEYEIARKLYDQGEYCAALKLLSPIAQKVPDPRVAQLIIADCSKKCKQDIPPPATPHSTSSNKTALFMPVIYRDKNTMAAEKKMAGSLDVGKICQDLQKKIPGYGFYPLSSAKVQKYENQYQDIFGKFTSVRDFGGFVMKKFTVTIGGFETLPKECATILEGIGKQEEARFFIFIKVISPETTRATSYTDASMHLNVYDLQVKDGRKLIHGSDWYHIGSPKELKQKTEDIEEEIMEAFGKIKANAGG